MIPSSTSATYTSADQKCAQLNQDCHCITLNRDAIGSKLKQWRDIDLLLDLIARRPYLFSESTVFVTADNLRKQQDIITAVESVISLPAFQKQVLSYAPASAKYTSKAHGVFFGYDFHLGQNGPQLIEINSNAGGALLNASMIAAANNCNHISQPIDINTAPEQLFLQMFQDEWQAENRLSPLRCIAIVDDNPQEQYLLPEFLLFKRLFEQHGLDVIICDPSELIYQNSRLWHGQKTIDLVYNRLTDFGLEDPTHQQLLDAYLSDAVVLTPHPRSHALYADKRNLSILTDEMALLSMGVDDATRAILLSGIAHTVKVKLSDADALWNNRKQLFFKPAKGYGSKAAYRGDKLTLRVFDEILHNDYVAQTLVAPGKRCLKIENEVTEFKFDLRMYVYRGQAQLTIARLYQGQTTNFRTPGGGFARVEVIRESK